MKAMTTALTEVIEKIQLLLPEEKRQVLARLIDDIDDVSDSAPAAEIEAEWIKEANRRLADIRDGNVKSVPAEQVFSEIRKSLGQ